MFISCYAGEQQVYAIQPVIRVPEVPHPTTHPTTACDVQTNQQNYTVSATQIPGNESHLSNSNVPGGQFIPVPLTGTPDSADKEPERPTIQLIVPPVENSQDSTSQSESKDDGPITIQHFFVTKVIANTPGGPKVMSESTLKLSSIGDLAQMGVGAPGEGSPMDSNTVTVVNSDGGKSINTAKVMLPQDSKGTLPQMPPITIVCDCQKEQRSDCDQVPTDLTVTPPMISQVDPTFTTVSTALTPITADNNPQQTCIPHQITPSPNNHSLTTYTPVPISVLDNHDLNALGVSVVGELPLNTVTFTQGQGQMNMDQQSPMLFTQTKPRYSEINLLAPETSTFAPVSIAVPTSINNVDTVCVTSR